MLANILVHLKAEKKAHNIYYAHQVGNKVQVKANIETLRVTYQGITAQDNMKVCASGLQEKIGHTDYQAVEDHNVLDSPVAALSST